MVKLSFFLNLIIFFFKFSHRISHTFQLFILYISNFFSIEDLKDRQYNKH